ncbi:Imm50 family immunity protein [Streptomyces sp. NPDC048018]|uniref:Imm50 family immunity protein n=1 Tax=Streptomyces sp. NPDC048018 TaxID=3365499 RepID=UPI00371AF1F8
MTNRLVIPNSQILTSLYGELPALDGLRLRSLQMNWRGPTVTLRVDLPVFPSRLPDEWAGSGVDTVQCHLQFLAVTDLTLAVWDPPASAVSFDVGSVQGGDRVRVTAVAPGVDLAFTSSRSALVGHVSAFRAGPDGSDAGRHLFAQALDRRRYESLPGPDEKNFYERL